MIHFGGRSTPVWYLPGVSYATSLRTLSPPVAVDTLEVVLLVASLERAIDVEWVLPLTADDDQ